MSALRKKFTDPDFRRDPKTDQWCAICQKDIRGTPTSYIHLVNGCMALHPDDEENYTPGVDGEDYGFQPVGPDCAQRLGKEWTHASKPAQELT